MARRLAMALTAAVLVLALSGCTARLVLVSWSPNPVVLKPGEWIKGTVTVQTTGVFGSIFIERVVVEALDEGDNVVDSEIFDINQSIPIFININESRDVEFDELTYDYVADEGVSKIRVTVTGSDPGVVEVEIKLDPPVNA